MTKKKDHHCFWSYCICTQFTSIYKRSQKWQRGRCHFRPLTLTWDTTRHDSTSQLHTETQTKPKDEKTPTLYHSKPHQRQKKLQSCTTSIIMPVSHNLYLMLHDELWVVKIKMCQCEGIFLSIMILWANCDTNYTTLCGCSRAHHSDPKKHIQQPF